MFPAACLSKNAILLHFLIEAPESAFEWLILSNHYLGHSPSLPSENPAQNYTCYEDGVSRKSQRGAVAKRILLCYVMKALCYVGWSFAPFLISSIEFR
jgi:hypothetical protein